MIATLLHKAASRLVLRACAVLLAASAAAPLHAAPFAYITNTSANTVSVVNLPTRTVVATIPVGTTPVAVGLDSAGTRVYVANNGDLTISVIDTSTQSVIATIPMPSDMRGLAVNPAGTRLYASSPLSDSLLVMDAVTGAFIASVPQITPAGVAVAPDGSRVYVARSGTASVSVVDTATNTNIALLFTGQLTPQGLAVSRDGSRLYVANEVGQSVSVFDTSTLALVSTWPMPGPVESIAVSPDGTLVFAAGGGVVARIDAATGAVTSISAPGAAGVGVHPMGTLVYVPLAAGSLRIYTNALVEIPGVSVGMGASAFGLFITPVPTISGASYDATTGVLTVSGAGMVANPGALNDIDVSKLLVRGEGLATWTLTGTPNVEITSPTSFSVPLSPTDKAAVNRILNKNGTVCSGGVSYNFAAAEGWIVGVSPGTVTVDSSIPLTVTNVPVPTITSATYDPTSGALVVTGTGFLNRSGAGNDIVANKFTFTGEGGGTHTLTDTSNADITSGTQFTLALSSTDRAAVNLLLNKGGNASWDGTVYNLGAAEDWAAGADAAVVVSDIAGNSVFVIDATPPTVVSIVRANGSPSNAASVTFTVTFSERVIGVNALSDFSVATSGLAGASVTGISGSGTLYNVTVSTGTGSGLLRLLLEDDDSINDGVNPLGGAGAGNGSFMTGEIYAIDRVAPAVTTVGVPANGTYVLGSSLDFVANFSEAVIVIGVPSIPLAIGATGRNATYIAGSGTTALTFRYTVQPGDVDADGIAVGSVIATNGGTLTDVPGNNAVLTLNGVASTAAVIVNAPVTFTVTPSAGANGTISPATPQTIAQGSTTSFTLTPAAGYTASVGGTCGGALVGPTYTTAAITANCTVAATFTQITRTVTPSAGANGTITPASPQTIAQGSTTSFTVTPATGYTASVGGTCGGALVGNTFTTNAITASCSVAATFAFIPVATYSGPSATGSGTITASFTGGGAGCTYTTSRFIPLSGDAASPPAGSAPATVTFPHGLFDFTLGSCTPGATITMTITYPAVLPPGTYYWKYGPTPSDAAPHWYVLPSTISGSTVTFSITDGGLGDDDLAANGTIVDQGGPGSGGAAAAVPTLSEWMMIVLAGLLLMLGMWEMRRRA
jgi:YVTN family beta-propeller protein